MKKTIVLGASNNPSRYSFLACQMLKERNVPFVPIGLKKGEVAGEEILDIRKQPEVENVDTVTLYIGPNHQEQIEEYLISLKPKRVIFNPGTYNPATISKVRKENIEVTEACTLVMLSTGQY